MMTVNPGEACMQRYFLMKEMGETLHMLIVIFCCVDGRFTVLKDNNLECLGFMCSCLLVNYCQLFTYKWFSAWNRVGGI